MPRLDEASLSLQKQKLTCGIKLICQHTDIVMECCSEKSWRFHNKVWNAGAKMHSSVFAAPWILSVFMDQIKLHVLPAFFFFVLF